MFLSSTFYLSFGKTHSLFISIFCIFFLKKHGFCVSATKYGDNGGALRGVFLRQVCITWVSITFTEVKRHLHGTLWALSPVQSGGRGSGIYSAPFPVSLVPVSVTRPRLLSPPVVWARRARHTLPTWAVTALLTPLSQQLLCSQAPRLISSGVP